MKSLLLSAIASFSLAMPSMARCPVPESAGDSPNYTATARYELKYKGSIYTLWEYRGVSPKGSVNRVTPVITANQNGKCIVAMDSRGDAPWAWFVPKEVAIAFAGKEIDESIKVTGRNRLQTLLLKNAEPINPEFAQALIARGFILRSDRQIYPWEKP